MKIKAVNIANALGISKATVSLVLNGKPGVSPITRQKVMRYLKEMQSADENSSIGKTIIIILAKTGKKIVCEGQMDLTTENLQVIDIEVKKMGYRTNIIYFNMHRDNEQNLIEQCNQEDTAGVILLASELEQNDFSCFQNITKRMMVFDNIFEKNRADYAVFANEESVERAVDYLISHGKKDIIYAANADNIYNFKKRRHGFVKAMERYRIKHPERKIIELGRDIDSNILAIERKMQDDWKLPEAIIAENYHVSIGIITAFKQNGVKVPKEVSLIAIDELPNYITPEYELTTVVMPTRARARISAKSFVDRLENNDEHILIKVSAKMKIGSSV
jgi:Transcriptional regulators